MPLQVPTIESQMHTAQRFVGLDAFHPPDDLAEGMLTQADNLYVQGGQLLLRPGFAGQLAAPFGNPLHARLAYLNADGTTDMILESGGRVYHTRKGATTASEIAFPGAGGLASAASRWARAARFGYRVDGAAPLLRTDLITSVAVSGLTTPAPAPVAALSASTLAQIYQAAQWAASAGPSSSQLLPGYGAASGSFRDAGWARGGHDPDIDSNNYFNADDASEYAVTGVLVNPGTGVYAKVFSAALDVIKDTLYVLGVSSPNPYGGRFIVKAFSDVAGTALIGTQEWDFTPASSFSGTLTHTFDFSALVSDIRALTVQVQGGAANTNGPWHFWVNNASLLPRSAAVTFAGGAGAGSGVFIGITGTSPSGIDHTSGIDLTVDLGTNVGLNALDTITFDLAGAAAWTGLGFHLAIQQAGSLVWVAASDPVIAPDFSTMTADVSTLPVADRTNVRKLKLTFTSDVTRTDPTSTIAIGPLLAGGNLTPAEDYYWVYTEVSAAGDVLLVNIIESNPSALSNIVRPTPDKATGQLILPAAPTNAGAAYFYLWRFGGVYKDGIGRLVTKRKFTDTVGYGADTGQPGSTGNAPNPYIAYAGTALEDNTPDSFLLEAETLVTGRDAPPVGAQAICAWQGRLWLAKGGRLYGSWLIAQDNQAALYFTNANLPNDPLSAVKGAQFSVGQDDNDPILALVPLGTNQYFSKGFLVIIKQSSVWLLSGTDPSNFSLQSFLVGSGIGGASGLAAALMGNTPWFLSADGVYGFDGNQAQNQSLLIEPLLNLPGLSAGVIANAALVYHDRRAFLLVPGAGAALNTQIFVYDTRQGGWTRWLSNPAAGPTGFTSGLSLSSQADSNDLYLAGNDGQLYHLAGSTDKPLPTSAGAAIAFTATTRGFGEEGNGMTVYRRRKATRMYAQVQTAAPLAGTLSVLTEAAAAQWSQAFTFTGLDSPRLKVPGVSGEFHQLKITGSASAPVTINSLSVDLVQGRISPS